MAVVVLSPPDCLRDHHPGILLLSSMERQQHPNPNCSLSGKRCTGRSTRDPGIHRLNMEYGRIRILKRGDVLDESPQQNPCSIPDAAVFYGGLTFADSPHPNSVPLPTFLGKYG